MENFVIDFVQNVKDGCNNFLLYNDSISILQLKCYIWYFQRYEDNEDLSMKYV